MSIRHYSLLVVFVAFTLSVSAQSIDQISISGRFQDLPVSEIAEQLILKAPQLKLFISNPELIRQTKTINFDNVPLDHALTRLFQNTPADYILYRNYAVVVGARSKINQTYSPDDYSRFAEILAAVEEMDETVMGSKDLLQPFGMVNLTGKVLDDLTGEEIVGASVLLSDSTSSTITNASGDFQIQIPTGKQVLIVQYIGYDRQQINLRVFSKDHLEVGLSKNVTNLEEVTIEAVAEDANVVSTQIGVTRLDLKGIDKIPVFMGEVDIEKVLLLQPGVSKVAEGASGFNVRGGEVDQNLVMQDEGFILNASHALGFLSTFNPDMVQSVVLYKGTIPAYYGGRLASVLDVKMRNGDTQRVRFKAGLSPITGKVNLELPVVKGKSSINLGVRYNYADILLKLGNTPDVQNSSSFFYDAQIRYSHKLNENNSLEFSFYSSDDDFRYSNEFGFNYQTLLGQTSFKSQINEKLFSNLSLVVSEYQSSRSDLEQVVASRLDNSVTYYKLKEHLTYTPSDRLKIDGGISGIYYDVDPGSIVPLSDVSVVTPEALENEQAIESAVFLQTEWMPGSKLSVSAGLRGVFYQYLGPQTVYQYQEGIPPSVETIQDTIAYTSGEVIENYSSLEPRLSLRYQLNPTASIKGGYSRSVQYINQISNFTAPTPSSVWQLSNTHVAPTKAHSFSLGLFKNFKQNLYESSIEGYYRHMDAIFDYKDFAELNVNDHIETELAAGIGRSYGLEFSVKKKRGLFNGWVSYTLSRTERQVDQINNGAWYLSNLDKTHDLSLVGIFDINERHSISINFNYATGRPTTAPIGSYRNDNRLVVPIYSERNQLRIPDFHRLDISYTIGQGYNQSKKLKTSWSFAIYNVYGRKNPYSVYFVHKPSNPPTANRFSVLGSVIPSVSFNIELR